MKKILLSLCLLIISTIALADVEFRFENADPNGGAKYLHPEEDQWYSLDNEVVFSQNDIKTANSIFTQSGVPGVELEFTQAGQEKFKSITTTGAGQRLAMLVDDEVVMVATIRQTIDAKKINLPIDTTVENSMRIAAAINASNESRNEISENIQTVSSNNMISDRLNQQSSTNINSLEDLENVVSKFVTGTAGKKLLDFFVSNWIFIFVGLFVFLPILKKILAALFLLLKSNMFKQREGGVHDVSKKLPSFFTGRRDDESATDKGQRLIGDGRYKEAIKYLRVYNLQNPKDVQANALLMNATEWSGMNQKSTLKQRENIAHDAQRKVQAEELRARSSSSTKVSQARSSLKLNKDQALRMAQSLIKQHKNS